MFDLEHEGPGHRVHRSQRSNSVAYIDLDKGQARRFVRQLSPLSGYSHFRFRDLENVGQTHGVQHSQRHRSIAVT